MNIKEFEQRLQQASFFDGVNFGRAHLLFEAEEKYSEQVLQFAGYFHMSDAFKCFFLETMELVNEHCAKTKLILSDSYPQFIPRSVYAFQMLVGAERAAIRGYPFLGYSSLRNTYDVLLLTSAVMQKVSTFYALLGIDPNDKTGYDPDKAFKPRVAEERRVFALMTGAGSGLSSSTIDELTKWDRLFNSETHGGNLFLAGTQEYLKGKANLSALPVFKDMDFALVMNRFCEIGWMAHRLLPLVQPMDAPLPDEWAAKWNTLDECFRVMVTSLSTQLKMKIGTAIEELVDKKFPFSAKSMFPI